MLCEMKGVRGGEEGFPVELWRDEDSRRLVVRAVNEGGFACVDIDLADLLNWLGIPEVHITAAITAAKHHQ